MDRKSMKPKRKQLNIRIPEFHLKILIELSEKYGLSQSEVVMMLLSKEQK